MNRRDHENEILELLSPSTDARRAGVLRAGLNADPDAKAELLEMESMMHMLDEWQAPEPSAWFDQRMAARLRAEIAAKPEGFFERLRSRVMFNTGAQLRPMLAGAMALLLVVGGGSYAGVHMLQAAPVQMSATVEDLQVLDNNEQTLQDMDQLLADDGSDDGQPRT